MINTTNDASRRFFLQAAAGLAAGPVITTDANAVAPSPSPSPSPSLSPKAPSFNVDTDPGKPGDFDFLSGEWKIQHRRLKNAANQEWDLFEGEATCWSILNGVVSIEELRIPARNFSGMGIRSLDVEQKTWSDFWVNAKSGVLLSPGVTGGFKNGAGIFISEEVEQSQSIWVRGLWDNISATTCRWQQASSRDGGQTWHDNWIMDWRRVR